MAIVLAFLRRSYPPTVRGLGDWAGATALLFFGGILPFAFSRHNGMVSGTVWVANEAGNSITAIDASTNRVLTTLSGIKGPHNLQAA